MGKIIYAAEASYWGTAAQKEMYETMCQYVQIIEQLTKVLVDKFAQMAESVDALVSNTSGVTSIPVRPRVWVQEKKSKYLISDI